jgi:hypothetical protein
MEWEFEELNGSAVICDNDAISVNQKDSDVNAVEHIITT